MPHIVDDDTLLFHPSNPGKVVVPASRGELFKLYREGYKNVNLKRIGRCLEVFREQNGLSRGRLAELLREHGGVFPAQKLTALLEGRLPYGKLSKVNLNVIRALLNMPMDQLVGPSNYKGAKSPVVTAIKKMRGWDKLKSREKNIYLVRLKILGMPYQVISLAENEELVRTGVQVENPGCQIHSVDILHASEHGMLHYIETPEDDYLYAVKTEDALHGHLGDGGDQVQTEEADYRPQDLAAERDT